MSFVVRYKITVEYNGGSFFGWQKQKFSTNSVQEIIENAIFNFSSEKVVLCCGGRTDAGVHALGQVAHFDMKKRFEPFKMRNAINYHLKSVPIAILKVEIVSNEFHARFLARRRHYVYKIVNRCTPMVLETGFAWQIFSFLDVNIMSEAVKYLIGKHNLSSFRSKNCQAKNPIRTIDNIEIVKTESNIYIRISAVSFLHKQVRIIVGTLAEFGKNKTNPKKMLNIINQCKREAAGVTAPPHGLYLIRIDY